MNSATATLPALDSFAAELRVRIAEAESALQAAREADDDLSVCIAETQLDDLRALAGRNDIAVDSVRV